MSKQTAVAKNPLIEDPKAEIVLLEAEQEAKDESADELDKLQNED